MKYLTYIMVFSFLVSCNLEDETYMPTPVPTPTVSVNLDQVPYPKLSDYNFFVGEIKNQLPATGVLPYKPTSELFTDYAKKKRFVWMPNGTKANYTDDFESLDLPIGSVLIKSFYYDNVQPSNTTKIIETRLMIRKQIGWIYAEYVWNEQQTDAVLQTDASIVPISWKNDANVILDINYKIPNEFQCNSCHSNNGNARPIGIKPITLNANYQYVDGTMNQLQKWINVGYLQNNLPSSILSVVDYNDTSKTLDLRVRSYFDINCAHCHQTGGSADYVQELNFAFNETLNSENMGVCLPAITHIPGQDRDKIVFPNSPSESYLFYSLNSTSTISQMPRLGRTILHQEGINLVSQWINSLQDCN